MDQSATNVRRNTVRIDARSLDGLLSEDRDRAGELAHPWFRESVADDADVDSVDLPLQWLGWGASVAVLLALTLMLTI